MKKIAITIAAVLLFMGINAMDYNDELAKNTNRDIHKLLDELEEDLDHLFDDNSDEGENDGEPEGNFSRPARTLRKTRKPHRKETK